MREWKSLFLLEKGKILLKSAEVDVGEDTSALRGRACFLSGDFMLLKITNWNLEKEVIMLDSTLKVWRDVILLTMGTFLLGACPSKGDSSVASGVKRQVPTVAQGSPAGGSPRPVPTVAPKAETPKVLRCGDFLSLAQAKSLGNASSKDFDVDRSVNPTGGFRLSCRGNGIRFWVEVSGGYSVYLKRAPNVVEDNRFGDASFTYGDHNEDRIVRVGDFTITIPGGGKKWESLVGAVVANAKKLSPI